MGMKVMRDELIKIFTLVYLSIVWGTTWVAIKYSLDGVPPFLGAMLRFMVALVCLWGYMIIRKISFKPLPGVFKYVFWSAVLLYLFDYGLIYWGEQYLNAGVTAIFFATFPLLTGVVSNFLFKNEAFQWGKYIGLTIGFFGIIVVFYDQMLITDFDGMVIWASLAILASALAAALSFVMVKKHLSGMETVSMTFHQMVWGVIILGVIGLARGEAADVIWVDESILAILYMGIFCTALAFVLYYAQLKKMSAISLSSIIYVNPLVAVFSGWILLDEAVTTRIVIGLSLIHI